MTDATSTDDTPTTGQKFAAEVLGTFVLVFFGVGAALMSGGDYVATGLSFGLTVVVMAYAVGRISGGHFNPAVTLGAVLGGRLPWNTVPIYIGAQLLGGLLAGAALFGLLHGFDGYTAEGNIGANAFGDQSASGYAMWAAFLLEALLTLIFLYVILAVTDERNEFQALMGPLTIGFALAMIHFASMGATGTSVNPARSIGVGVFGGTDAIIQLWLFIVAPLVGAAIAGLTYPLIFGHGSEPVAGSGSQLRRRPPQAAGATPRRPTTSSSGTRASRRSSGRPLPRSSSGASPAAPVDPYAQPAQQQQPPAQQWGQPQAAPSRRRRSSGASRPPTPTLRRQPPAAAGPAVGTADRGRRRGRPHPGASPRLICRLIECRSLTDVNGPAPRGPRRSTRSAPARPRARSSGSTSDAGSSGVVCAISTASDHEPYGVDALAAMSSTSARSSATPGAYSWTKPSPTRGRAGITSPASGAVDAGPPVADASTPPEGPHVPVAVLGVVAQRRDGRRRCARPWSPPRSWSPRRSPASRPVTSTVTAGASSDS